MHVWVCYPVSIETRNAQHGRTEMNTDLTPNELAAAIVLVKSCLDGMGGSRPADLASDEYTWVDAKVLMKAGWNKNEASGTFGALMEKGFISEYDKNEWAITTEAWKFLDTIWDAQTAPAPKAKKAKKVATRKDATKYVYPAGLTAAQKKVFRAKARRAK